MHALLSLMYKHSRKFDLDTMRDSDDHTRSGDGDDTPAATLFKEKVMIAGRAYPVSVDESERAIISQIEREINENIRDFQSKYANLSVQDCLAMMIISDRIEHVKEVDPLSTKIDTINNLILGQV